MAIESRLSCDQCGQSDFLHQTDGTPTDTRVSGFRWGWFYNDGVDLCPVCSGRNRTYFDTDPF